MGETFEFFHEAKGERAVRPVLFSEDACKEAKTIQRSKFTSSQFRNYFQELRGLEARYMQREREEPENAWRDLQPQLHLFKAKLAYGMRRNGTITSEFRTFMDKLINTGLESSEAFKTMMLFLEAVLAYFYAHENNQGGC